MGDNRPKVGIGVMIFKDGKVLLGKRKNAHGDGEWATPGGYLEYMESFEDCARRETKEEVGVEIDNVQFVCLFQHKKFPPRHHVGVGMKADWKSGDPQVLEPDKMVEWGWFDPDNLPSPLFGTIGYYKEIRETGRNCFDG